PHEVWQMDACEQIPLGNGQRVCWLRGVDECSGAILWTEVFASARWPCVGAALARDALRRQVSGWGLPAKLRVAIGGPWGSTGGLPTEFAMWGLGLGVAVLWNQPHCPQENGCVERSMGTTKRWVGPAQCGDVPALVARLQREDWVQREAYPDRA